MKAVALAVSALNILADLCRKTLWYSGHSKGVLKKTPRNKSVRAKVAPSR